MSSGHIYDYDPCQEDMTFITNYTHWTGRGGAIIAYTEETRYGYITECRGRCVEEYIDLGECNELEGIGEDGNCAEFYIGCSTGDNVRVCGRDWDKVLEREDDFKACCETGLDNRVNTMPLNKWLDIVRSGTGRLNCHPLLCPGSELCINTGHY